MGLMLAALARPVLATPTASPGPTPAAAAIVARAAGPGTRDLYSMRARRMVQAYLRLRLLELRETDLERARAVIEGRLRVDDLFSPTPGQASDRGATR
jgi:hypothetical protein